MTTRAHRHNRHLGSVHIYARMGVLPVTVAFTEADREMRRSREMARQVRQGAALEFTTSQGEHLTFREAPHG